MQNFLNNTYENLSKEDSVKVKIMDIKKSQIIILEELLKDKTNNIYKKKWQPDSILPKIIDIVKKI